MKPKDISFYLFGDSICFGQLVNAHQTWATKLASSLNEISELIGNVLVQNAGVNGNTTRQALERMNYDVSSHNPDFVMVQFGMNDCNYWASDRELPRVTQQAYMANLEEIVERAVISGAHHCFLNTNHPSLKGGFAHYNDKTYDQSNAEYNEMIRKVYQRLIDSQKPVTLIDMEKSWKDYLVFHQDESLENLLLTDGIHLSPIGHQIYSDVIIPVVKAKLIKVLQ